MDIGLNESHPNVTITPDGKWVVFKSNIFGALHVFAVETRTPDDNREGAKR
jgi:hypothetical protein